MFITAIPRDCKDISSPLIFFPFNLTAVPISRVLHEAHSLILHQLNASINSSISSCPPLSSATKAARASSASEAGPQTATASEALRSIAASWITAAIFGRPWVTSLHEAPLMSLTAPVTNLGACVSVGRIRHGIAYASMASRPVSRADLSSFSMTESIYDEDLRHVHVRCSLASGFCSRAL